MGQAWADCRRDWELRHIRGNDCLPRHNTGSAQAEGTAVPITDGGAGGYAEIGPGGIIKVVSRGAGTNYFSLAYIAS